MYGTSNSAYAVAAARKQPPTYSAAGTPVSGGPANTRKNAIGSVHAPASSQGLRGPQRETVRSDQRPTRGLRTRSQTFGAATTTPASHAGTARKFVM
ncbi:hypothetical protein GCM10020220_073830 [Nonomuraea rubra]